MSRASLRRAAQTPETPPKFVVVRSTKTAMLEKPLVASVQTHSYVLPARQACTRHCSSIARGLSGKKSAQKIAALPACATQIVPSPSLPCEFSDKPKQDD